MKPLPRALYFPFTYVAPPVMEILQRSFRPVVVYQPVGSRPAENLTGWVDSGALEIRIPFKGHTDEKALLAGLGQWKSWASLNRGSDLSYLRHLGKGIAPAAPAIPKLVSEIAGTRSPSEDREDPDLTCQLFLLLAQDFDEQMWELRRHLGTFGSQSEALQAFLRIDDPEEAQPWTLHESLSGPGEDLGSLMTERRLKAWYHLFRRHPVGGSLLLTDSPACYAFLLEGAEESFEVLTCAMPHGKGVSDTPAWRETLGALLQRLISMPWGGGLEKDLEETRGRIETLLGGGLQGQPHGTEAKVDPQRLAQGQDKGLCPFRCTLVPGLSPGAFLQKKLGPYAGDEAHEAANTLICLMETEPV